MPPDLASEIRAMGLKATPQRIEIIRALKDNRDRHPSMGELHAMVKKRMPSVSFSTLYNTLSALDRIGYIRLFDIGGETHIELNPDDHINVIDQRTGEILDIEDSMIVSKVLEGLDKDRIKDRKVLINVIVY
jgi:Fur family peroxide stress response transcriptional regulator